MFWLLIYFIYKKKKKKKNSGKVMNLNYIFLIYFPFYKITCWEKQKIERHEALHNFTIVRFDNNILFHAILILLLCNILSFNIKWVVSYSTSFFSNFVNIKKYLFYSLRNLNDESLQRDPLVKLPSIRVINYFFWSIQTTLTKVFKRCSILI